MLNEERKAIIIQTVEREGSVSVQDLMRLLDTSESTIRRDLTELDKRKLLVKVHGGAITTSAPGQNVTADIQVSEREAINRESKCKIAEYAAGMITDSDVVFLDAGTTTGFIVDYVTTKGTLFVTNAITHARKLNSQGFRVIMPGGELKSSTEALVGAVTCHALDQYHFTKGFFGTNGITRRCGCTTPDSEEAAVKELAAQHCRECFVLADSSKFGQISTVTFAAFRQVTFITDDELEDPYRQEENVHIVS